MVRRGVTPFGVSVATQNPGPSFHSSPKMEWATEVVSQAGQAASLTANSAISVEAVDFPSVGA